MARIQDFINRQFAETPKQEVGIGGFTALVRVRERMTMGSTIPTTPVEDGSFVNDHIIPKPLVLNIEGDVADVHLDASPSIRQFQRLQAEIGNVTSQYAPSKTQAQLSKINALANDVADAVRAIDNLIDTGDQVLDYFGNKDSESKSLQEQFIDVMDALYKGKQAFAIDMPFRRHEQMVITSLIISYDNQVNTTTFALEAQQIQYADLKFVQVEKKSPGLFGQADSEVSKGSQEGEQVTESLATQILNAVLGGE